MTHTVAMNTGSGTREFESWYRESYRTVAESIALMAGSRALADDVVAEAFARALERWPRVSSMDSPEGWVLVVARNLLRRTQRRRALEARVIGRVAARGTISEVPLGDDELWRAVAQLTPREREVVAWRYVMDLKEADAARQMSISPGTVARLLHDARKKLRDELAKNATEA